MHLVHIRLVLKFATRCPLLLYVNMYPGFLEAIKDLSALYIQYKQTASPFSLVTNKTYKSMINGNYEQMVKSKYVE